MFSERVQSRAAQREATRQRVLSTAERLFRDQGFGATTVRQIAADASAIFQLTLIAEITEVLARAGLDDAGSS
ncbi:TetR family transcriptional regulator [Streptomyces noursei]|uniref:TetR family transcriptional regulator n=1 Tax=Streptomyces noursei TaxID=1971 RepID=UPI0033C6F89A